MADSIYIGNFASGLTTNRKPFNISNDAFPVLYNFYIKRGRANRKRGTIPLARLQRQVKLVANATPPASWQFGENVLIADSTNLLSATVIAPGITQAAKAVITVNGHIFQRGDTVILSGVIGMTEINGNPYTVYDTTPSTITLNVNSTGFTAWASGGKVSFYYGSPSLVPGSISVVVGANTYTDPGADGILVGTPAGSGTVNYTTGAVTITGGGGASLTGTYSYYPGLPVMGLEDFVSNASAAQYPLLLAFDTRYSYQIQQAAGSSSYFYSTTYYKTTSEPFTWSGADYQQFWSTNYSGALWATNNVPGLNLLFGTYAATIGTGDTIQYNFYTDAAKTVPFTKLIVGDKLWFNEWPTAGAPPTNDINGIVGTVVTVVDAATGSYQVQYTFIPAIVGATGIVQMLTNTLPGQDGIKWYDGDQTGGTGLPLSTSVGWVNFAPPLTATNVAIDNHPSKLYYLVGALAILPFKDRLLFFSPWIQSSAGTPINLTDTVLWSWNGTPYYTVSDSSNTPSTVPDSQTADPRAYYVDQTGLGGYLPAGLPYPIKTVSNNEDVLLIGFGGDGIKTRFSYTGNDLQPFLFYNINSELPSSSTYSAVTLDKGAIDIGQYGIAMTDQQSSERIDLQIPDFVFDIQAINNGTERVNAIRDFFNEFIYFSYPVYPSPWKFPTQTFLFNYRDNTWAILYENFTKHGNFRPTYQRTWNTIGFPSWDTWREPWNTGARSPQFSNIVAGNPQGFVNIIGQGTAEAPSGDIKDISSSGGGTLITSTNHCVQIGDFIYLSGAIGIVTSTITAITKGTTTVITTANSFSVGQNVFIDGVTGMIDINGHTYKILAASGTSITIELNSSSFNDYVSGGTAQLAFNGQVTKVIAIGGSTPTPNSFTVDLDYPTGSAYIGGGTFSRLSKPLMLTKQFNPYWEQGRQVRLSVQKYLMEYTSNSQVTVNIYLSQDQDQEWNSLVNQGGPPNSLVYSQIMYTCPESTNIGLTPFNVSLQNQISSEEVSASKQIWHRDNTSLIGDSFQAGITLSDEQMYNLTYATSEIKLHGMHFIVNPSSHLA